MAATPDAEAHVDAVVAVEVGEHGAHLGAEAALERRGSASTIVTSRPLPRAVAATSAPMNPAPITTTRPGAASKAARRASESSSVRSTKTPSRAGWPGSRRGAAPVAMTRPS